MTEPPAQQQSPPGLIGQMDPEPDHGESSYRGSGRLTVEQARAGAELMHYAGAPVEIALLFLVCRPWLLPKHGRESAHGARQPQAP